MIAKTFFTRLTNGRRDIVQILLQILEDTHSEYCLIGGLAVNAYADPVVSLDLDLVVVSARVDALREAAHKIGMKVEEFEHSVNLSLPESDLRIQIQTDSRYQEFVARSRQKDVLGYRMAVASLEDILQGKLWAYSDTTRRKSKRQKDLADIMRLVETHPELKTKIPAEMVSQFE